MLSDFLFITKWYAVILIIGVSYLPLSFYFFSKFIDRGYIFSKILGIGIISYITYLLGSLHILPFSRETLFFIVIFSFLANYIFFLRKGKFLLNFRSASKIILVEEVLFLVCLFLWSFVRATQPDINGLEKYMDFGFINSILRSTSFPPADVWLTPHSINYYYFGHLTTAVLTKISGIPSYITFNLMVATIFSLTLVSSFSLGTNLAKNIFGGVFTALLVTFGGNLHTIYSFFVSYQGNNPVPFWELAFSPFSFPNSYWYPNATRFIQNTIHEFPVYSFVVSDLHGHLLNVPFVLLTIAALFSMFLNLKIGNRKLEIPLIGFLLALLYMTNTLSGPIYLLLSILIFLYIAYKTKAYSLQLANFAVVAISFFIFTLPFTLSFKPFVSGIGLLCSPSFLLDIEKFGPFIFEPGRCQRSEWWQLLILYGFFYFLIFYFFLFIKEKTKTGGFIFILIFLSSILIVIPEFLYIKDIYPAHYRANTMFKFVYEAFIILSIVSGYILTRLIFTAKNRMLGKSISILLFILVMVYPYFSIKAYYNNLSIYKGLDGISYLKNLYPEDFEAVTWLNKNIEGQPVILEAQGDSYTNFGRISANTGLPTVLGWTVHEWLWRGSYDVPAPRIQEVRELYESGDLELTENLIRKYNIEYVFVGNLERQNYSNLYEQKFQTLGEVVFKSGTTKIYKINF